jgi:hypothetical protein
VSNAGSPIHSNHSQGGMVTVYSSLLTPLETSCCSVSSCWFCDVDSGKCLASCSFEVLVAHHLEESSIGLLKCLVWWRKFKDMTVASILLPDINAHLYQCFVQLVCSVTPAHDFSWRYLHIHYRQRGRLLSISSYLKCYILFDVIHDFKRCIRIAISGMVFHFQ